MGPVICNGGGVVIIPPIFQLPALWGFSWGTNQYFAYNPFTGRYKTGTVSGLENTSRVRYGRAVVDSRIFFGTAANSTKAFEVVDIASSTPVVVANPTKTEVGLVSNYECATILRHPNGYIYMTPYTPSMDYIVRIDPTNYSTTLYSINSWISGADGGVVGYDGNIYITPSYGDGIMCFNPTTNTVTKPYTFTYASYLYSGCVQAPNGIIYGIPYDAQNGIMVLNVGSSSFSQIKQGYQGQYHGGLCVIDPSNANNILSYSTYNWMSQGYKQMVIYNYSTNSETYDSSSEYAQANSMQPWDNIVYYTYPSNANNPNGGYSILKAYNTSTHTQVSLPTIQIYGCSHLLTIAPQICPMPNSAADLIGTTAGRLWNLIYNH